MYSKLARLIDRTEKIDITDPYVFLPDQRVYGQLGDIVFVVSDGLESFKDKQGYDIVEHSIMSGKNVLQSMGNKLIEINIGILFCNFFGQDVTEELASLQSVMREGVPMEFMFGKGEDGGYYYKGKYIITAITTNILKTSPEGVIGVARSSITMKEWVFRETTEITKVEIKPQKKQQKKRKEKVVKKKEQKILPPSYYDKLFSVRQEKFDYINVR